ncbi:GH25 family lysozyme [Actinomadura rudentiformis]|uniref:lysozyme n=1 Tax=Actinomadura rudentiformis TaxID=359158 RepID=A0A6H9YXH3_9ACTN|nr:GH25 family lysozyme [Actinomadura rudentiformis]KAB2350955.1 hypothetical protein F8566_08365 [Actinomadura rudentiformis]
MKRLTVPARVGLAAATAVSGVAISGSAFADPSPPPSASAGLRPGDAYAGVGQAATAPRGGYSAKAAPAGIRGVDVASYQGPSIDWAKHYRDGIRFAFVKATEGADTRAEPDGGYVNPYFAAQYNGSRNAKLLRGAYHFALPHKSSGAVQADWFINHGGGWRQDGWTLPGVLDVENNPYSNNLDTCYNLKPAQMVNWIRAFSDRYFQRTGRRPMIYTNTAWWVKCTGANATFGSHPLWVARYNTTPGAVPPGWKTHTMWQYAPGTAGNPYPTGNWSVFNGSWASLQKLAVVARTGFAGVNAGPEPVRRGRALTVLGRLYAFNGGWKGLPGKRVNVYFRAKGSAKWVYAGAVTTDRYGKFRKRFTAKRDGSWRVAFWGGPRYFGTTSGSDYVDVR